MPCQVKAKERVRKHGEVFTNQREVNAMLDMIDAEALSIDSTFFEPACGTGNFLAEIQRRKLETVFRLAPRNQADGEHLAMQAIASIYGVDIQKDNVLEARERLYNNFFANFVNQYKRKPTNICLDSVRFILCQNIQCGNTLTCQGEGGAPLYITQWAFDDGNGLTIRIYDYKQMVDTGCDCAPVHMLPRIPYVLLPAIIQK